MTEQEIDLINEEENDKAIEELNAAHRQAIADMSPKDKIDEAPPELSTKAICQVLKSNPDETIEDMLGNDISGKMFHKRFYQITVDLHELDFTEIDEHLYQEGAK